MFVMFANFSKLFQTLLCISATLFFCIALNLDVPHLEKTIEILENRSILLECSPAQSSNRQWFFNGTLLVKPTRWHISKSSLQIKRANYYKDNGSFKCQIANEQNKIIASITYNLKIQWLNHPEVQTLSPIDLKIGSSFTLKCNVNTSINNDLKFIWLRNFEPLSKSSRVETKKKKLSIKSLRTSDNGVYKCIVSSELYEMSRQSLNSYNLAVESDKTAKIIKAPENFYGVLKGDGNFQCSFDHSERVEWYFNKTGPLISGKKYEIKSTGDLIIKSLTELDKGIYTCVGIRSNQNDLSQSYAAQLFIAYIEKFAGVNFEPEIIDFKNGQIFITENRNFSLTCLSPNSDPNASVIWNMENVANRTNIKINEENQLEINQANINNSGYFMCDAQNIAGFVQKRFLITVTKPPEVSINPLNLTIDENDLLLLTCEVSNTHNLPFRVKWYFNESLVNDIIENGNKSSFEVPDLKSQNSGKYYCVIELNDEISLKSKETYVKVSKKFKFNNVFAKETAIEAGKTTKLHCKNSFQQEVSWLLNNSRNFPKNVFEENGTLIIENAQLENQGDYTCNSNFENESINMTTFVRIVLSPKFKNTIPKTIQIEEGDKLFLHCSASGDPTPSIHWDKDLKLNNFDRERVLIFKNNSLLISNVIAKDEGIYGCFAGNSVGFTRMETLVLIKSFRDDEDEESNLLSSKILTKNTILITSIASIVYLVISIVIIAMFKLRKQVDDDIGNIDVNNLNMVNMDNVEQHDHHLSISDLSDHSNQSFTTLRSSEIRKITISYENIFLNSQNISDVVFKSRGQHCDIFHGKFASSETNNQRVNVLIKSFLNLRQNNSLSDFQHELNMFYKLKHDNLVRVFGICLDANKLMLVLDYHDYIDLKQYLIEKRIENNFSKHFPQICQQLAHGMKFLTDNNLVHRDLSARNCIISLKKINAKIANTKMCCEIYNKEYCRFQNQVIPLRWMPYEAVYCDEYSKKTDVYSFGVLLWEIYSFGDFPLKKFSDKSVLEMLRNNELNLTSNSSAPKVIKDLERKCWEKNADDRPDFEFIVQKLSTEL